VGGKIAAHYSRLNPRALIDTFFPPPAVPLRPTTYDFYDRSLKWRNRLGKKLRQIIFLTPMNIHAPIVQCFCLFYSSILKAILLVHGRVCFNSCTEKRIYCLFPSVQQVHFQSVSVKHRLLSLDIFHLK
jgi:hypothetical protein